jgi:DNA uptake protein ComE-like DNA-binding protein
MQLFWILRLPTIQDIMRTLIFLPILVIGCASIACSNNPNTTRQQAANDTQQIKQDSAKAAEQIKKGAEQARTDLTAAAQGVKEGLQSNSQVDLNTADKSQLMSLPGITDQQASAIIADRPYSNTHDAVAKGAISESEYQAIKDRVIAKQNPLR